jgi:hypothetical protein
MSIFTDKVSKYNNRLQKDLTLDRIPAAGIWGNIGGETGGFKYLQELHPTVQGSAGGYGWKQWTGPRRRAYMAWCKANNLKPEDDESNYRYVVWEGLNSEKYAISKLRQAKTIEEATECYMKYDLRPGTPHLENRIKWAKIALDASTPSTTKTVVTHPLTKTVGGVVAGGAAATQVVPVDYYHYIIYGSIGILLTAVTIYVYINTYSIRKASKGT